MRKPDGEAGRPLSTVICDSSKLNCCLARPAWRAKLGTFLTSIRKADPTPQYAAHASDPRRPQPHTESTDGACERLLEKESCSTRANVIFPSSLRNLPVKDTGETGELGNRDTRDTLDKRTHR